LQGTCTTLKVNYIEWNKMCPKQAIQTSLGHNLGTIPSNKSTMTGIDELKYLWTFQS